MIRKTFSDKDEINELKKDLIECRKQLELLPNTKIEGDFTDREKRITEYLKENSDVSKESVIKKLTEEGVGSRVTVIKAIKNLASYGVISARKDKGNSPAYKLHLNQNSDFISVYSELEELKNAFSNLIEKLGDTPITPTNTNTAGDPFYNTTNATRYYDLLFIYQHILGVYLTYSVLIWPNSVKDKLILNKIHAVMFYRMIEIQNKVTEVFKLQKGMPDLNDATFGQVSNPILQEFINTMFFLRPQKVAEIIKDYGVTSIKKSDLTKEKEGVKKDIALLLEVVWKIGFPIYLYLDPNIWSDFLPEDIDKLKDWKYAMTNYLASDAQRKYHITTPPDAAKET